MIAANALPNRRVEGWRWSDLSAALAGRDLPIIPGDRHVLARLAIGARRMAGIVVNAGETRTEIERVGGEGVDLVENTEHLVWVDRAEREVVVGHLRKHGYIK